MSMLIYKHDKYSKFRKVLLENLCMCIWILAGNVKVSDMTREIPLGKISYYNFMSSINPLRNMLLLRRESLFQVDNAIIKTYTLLIY